MTPDHEITAKQAELDKLYDSFSAKYGLINSKGNRLAFSDDSSYYLLCSLEVLDEDNKFLRKADMFTKRTIRQARAVTSVDTASEALAVSIAEHACVDMTYMSQLSGKSVKELVNSVQIIPLFDQNITFECYKVDIRPGASGYLKGIVSAIIDHFKHLRVW